MIVLYPSSCVNLKWMNLTGQGNSSCLISLTGSFRLRTSSHVKTLCYIFLFLVILGKQIITKTWKRKRKLHASARFVESCICFKQNVTPKHCYIYIGRKNTKIFFWLCTLSDYFQNNVLYRYQWYATIYL